ncbi:HEPN domain-containing protein [Mangrovibacterium diazotrophicum]|uniref:Uncharacterized protein n=1 Tax=Mangrovibacterium diazotrophicum TaxID=1261403 RepID=A0A419W304_9BACT|nr:HEPN domain-containing protein [Mangrovibacterium diazotrophicum]RKD89861.1 hypothetical protein BC643_0194 [Mangrovibacterium diazotrophicum]
MKTNYVFEVLCLDSSEKSVIKNEKNLAYSLMANGDLWIEPKQREASISDEKQNLTLGIKQLSREEESDTSLKNTFLIKCKGDYEPLEVFRLRILAHLKNQGYSYLYILSDDVSAKISCEIYPKINQVENQLRKYLIKFFITKLGVSWWNVTADAEMKKKVIQRKNNETDFSEYIDNKAYLIDFNELGKIVHSQSSGFLSRDDIANKVLALEETPEAIKTLKRELESNYTKFFKDTFKDKEFQQKWEELEKIRHKVAHNNLFTAKDLERSEEICKNLFDIIKEANEKIDNISFSLDEKDLIKENITQNFASYNVISEEKLLEKLDESESWAAKTRDNFVSLKHFVTNFLGSQGYDYRSSYDLINLLERKGLVELWEFKGPNNLYPVTAIRRLKGSLAGQEGLAKLKQEMKN